MQHEIKQGHALALAKELPDDSIDMAFFSPPYFWARKYDVPDQVWGGDVDCPHHWVERSFYHCGGGGNASDRFVQAGPENSAMRKAQRWQSEANCSHCAAWRGQFGREQTAQQYAQHLGLLCKELFRVIKPTGGIWINTADTYYQKAAQLIPERTAIVVAESGFSPKSTIIWDKRSSAIQSDRPDNSTEVVIFATKARDRQRYFYNREAAHCRDKVWNVAATGRKGHEAGCNVNLPLMAMALGCPVGGTVLDPFAGSGSTMEAAKLLGCNSIGFELNSSHAELLDREVQAQQ
jgi:DNA modification methylase